MKRTCEAHLERHHIPGVDATELILPSHRELFVTAIPRAEEPLPAVLDRVAEVLRTHHAQALSAYGFGAPTVSEAFPCPVTWVQEKKGSGEAVRGIQVWAVSGVDAVPVEVDGVAAGAVFACGNARILYVAGPQPAEPSAAPAEQAALLFEQMGAVLQQVGMDFSHVLRTWFFLDDILAWYGAFNKVRDAFFRDRGLFEGLVPASTGIGGSNPAGAALAAGLLAVQSLDGTAHATAVSSPRQGPALEYGSSFSRAVELALPGHRRLYVSGTASIDPEGRTLHVGNVNAQVDHTMQVVHAILKSRGMDWADVTRAIVYVKHAEDTPRFAAHCAEQGLPPLPAIVVVNDVCRDDLLFEIELDAIAVSSSG